MKIYHSPFGNNKNVKCSVPIYPHPGSFGARRKHEIHTGVDLYVPIMTKVYPIEDGIVTAIVPFTGPHAGSDWWKNTWAILVHGRTGTFVYGEIEPDESVSVGMKVKGGETQLGRVIPVIKHVKETTISTTMLHIELLNGFSTVEAPMIDHSGNNLAEDFQNVLDPTLILIQTLGN